MLLIIYEEDDMYKLNNLYNKAPLTISVEHGNKKVIFDVHSLLEEYLNYKGDIFKSTIYIISNIRPV